MPTIPQAGYSRRGGQLIRRLLAFFGGSTICMLNLSNRLARACERIIRGCSILRAASSGGSPPCAALANLLLVLFPHTTLPLLAGLPMPLWIRRKYGDQSQPVGLHSRIPRLPRGLPPGMYHTGLSHNDYKIEGQNPGCSHKMLVNRCPIATEMNQEGPLHKRMLGS